MQKFNFLKRKIQQVQGIHNPYSLWYFRHPCCPCFCSPVSKAQKTQKYWLKLVMSSFRKLMLIISQGHQGIIADAIRTAPTWETTSLQTLVLRTTMRKKSSTWRSFNLKFYLKLNSCLSEYSTTFFVVILLSNITITTMTDTPHHARW